MSDKVEACGEGRSEEDKNSEGIDVVKVEKCRSLQMRGRNKNGEWMKSEVGG